MSRDQEVLVERLRGDTLATIAEHHDLSVEGVRLVVAREGRRHIERLIGDCWCAKK